MEILEGFATLTMAAVIMRLGLLAFILPTALESLYAGTTNLVELLLTGIAAAVLSLGQRLPVKTLCGLTDRRCRQV